MKETTCGFTGHRPHKLPFGYNENHPRCTALKAAIERAVLDAIEDHFCLFISGMALGCDTYFAEIVLKLREEYPHIRLEAALPSTGQADRWSQPDRARYERILARCDVVTDAGGVPGNIGYHRRNRYIVEHSGRLIAVEAGHGGGSASTTRLAEKAGIQVVRIKP